MDTQAKNGSARNNAGLLTQENIFTSRNSQGVLIQESEQDSEHYANEEFEGDSENRLKDPKGKDQHFSEACFDSGEIIFIHLMQFVILF